MVEETNALYGILTFSVFSFRREIPPSCFWFSKEKMESDYGRILEKMYELVTQASFALLRKNLDVLIEVLKQNGGGICTSTLSSLIVRMIRDALENAPPDERGTIKNLIGAYGWEDSEEGGQFRSPIESVEDLCRVLTGYRMRLDRVVQTDAERVTMEEVEYFLRQWDGNTPSNARKEEVLRRINRGDMTVLLHEQEREGRRQ